MRTLLLITFVSLISTSVFAKEKLVFYTGKGATIQEISVLVLKEAYGNIGYDVEIQYLPNARALVSSNMGLVDGEVSRITGIEKNFSNLIQVPVAVNFLEGVAFTKDSSLKITDWESLAAYRLVCVKGVKFVERNLEKRKIVCHEVPFFPQAIQLLQYGRYDVAVFPRTNGLNAVKEAQASDIFPVGEPLIKMKLYHYLHQKNAKLVRKIQLALEEMEKRGRIAAIRKEFIQNMGADK